MPDHNHDAEAALADMAERIKMKRGQERTVAEQERAQLFDLLMAERHAGAEMSAELERIRQNRDEWERIADSRLGIEDEVRRLRASVNVQGNWVCESCGVHLVHKAINVATGDVGTLRMEEIPECPNARNDCPGPMRPQTWREACEKVEEYAEQVPDLRARIAELERDRERWRMLCDEAETELRAVAHHSSQPLMASSASVWCRRFSDLDAARARTEETG